MHGRGSAAVRNFAMFGETTGEVDEFGLPVRLEWAREYRGRADVVFGHVPVREAEWLNSTLDIDTGCVFGAKLTALRWPERATVSVPAAQQYAEPTKPLDPGDGRTAQQDHDRLLYFDDFATKQRIETGLGGTVVIPEENALAALEVMSRFAIDPRWLIHLPPTMAACPTAAEGPFLEHPHDALDHYAKLGVTDLVAEEKHMGSRALMIVCRDAAAAAARFGTEDGKRGVIYTRAGRPFFKDDGEEAAVIARVAAAVGSAGLWEALSTDWVLLDAELMPWSAKAQELLRQQYLPTVVAAKHSAEALLDCLSGAQPDDALASLAAAVGHQRENARRMGETIDGYYWQADTIDALRIAPFHLLAAKGLVFTDREALVARWLEHTGKGGEGMVQKPASFLSRGEKGLVQPAMKVRGRDCLRIIYGPDHDLPENIERLF
ncbi:MAG: hypothetical protein AAFU49_13995 [Pseudomonadota bacterium]